MLLKQFFKSWLYPTILALYLILSHQARKLIPHSYINFYNILLLLIPLLVLLIVIFKSKRSTKNYFYLLLYILLGFIIYFLAKDLI